MELFTVLGFHWNRSTVPSVVPIHSIDRVAFRFHRMLPEFVWDASVLEGNPFTFPEVKTLLDGVTIGGRKISDQEQVLNLAEAAYQPADRANPDPLGQCQMIHLAHIVETHAAECIAQEGHRLLPSQLAALAGTGSLVLKTGKVR